MYGVLIENLIRILGIQINRRDENQLNYVRAVSKNSIYIERDWIYIESDWIRLKSQYKSIFWLNRLFQSFNWHQSSLFNLLIKKWSNLIEKEIKKGWFNGKDNETRSKLWLTIWVLSSDSNRTKIDDQIWTAWNLNHQRFDSEALTD